MALIYFVIFVSAFSTALCDCNNPDNNPGSDKVVLNVSHLYLIGFLMLFMLLIIICLCFILYKRKKALTTSAFFEEKVTIDKNKTHMIKQCKFEESSQTLCSGITEIKELNEPTVTICVEENKTPVVVKKNNAPQIPLLQKQQMDNLIQEVLKRKPRSDSISFRDLISMTKRKSVDIMANNSLNKKSNKSGTSTEVNTNDDLYGNISVKDESYSNPNNNIVEEVIERNSAIKAQEECDGAAAALTEHIAKLDDVYVTPPKPVQELDDAYDILPTPEVGGVEIYDTVPSTVVTVVDVYDTVPSPVAVVDVYDTVPNLTQKVDDIYDTVPNSPQAVDDIYDTVPNSPLKSDDVYDTVPNEINDVNKDNITTPHHDIEPSVQKNVHAIVDTETNYVLLVADKTDEHKRYINANEVKNKV